MQKRSPLGGLSHICAEGKPLCGSTAALRSQTQVAWAFNPQCRQCWNAYYASQELTADVIEFQAEDELLIAIGSAVKGEG